MGDAALTNYFRGLLPSVEPSDGSRLPLATTTKLTGDTTRAAKVLAGVHLAITGSAAAIDVDVVVGARTSVPAPTVGDHFVVHVVDRPPVRVDIPEQGGTIRVPLSERPVGGIARVYLPETVELQINSIIPVDGDIAPAPRGPRWVVYGDSISQGWSVADAGLAWPSIVAQSLGLDLVNLGFAGSARGELLVADAVADSGADAVAIVWGTNAWSSLPTDSGQIAQTMRIFLTAVRQGLPQVPIVVVSPILRPDAEAKPNRFGATLADLRGALEGAVRQFVTQTGDQKITVVDGLPLVPADQLADGIHPGDEGHRTMATAIAPHVAAGLAMVSGSPAGR